MARLLVHLHSPVPTGDEKYDAHVAANHPRAGDIVSIVEDDHVFSRIEMTNGQYHVIDVPGVAMQDLAHLNETHVDEKRGVPTGRRVRHLNHVKLHADRQRSGGHSVGPKGLRRADLDAFVKTRE